MATAKWLDEAEGLAQFEFGTTVVTRKVRKSDEADYPELFGLSEPTAEIEEASSDEPTAEIEEASSDEPTAEIEDYDYTPESLNDMHIKSLQKFAKGFGIEATTKQEIIFELMELKD